MRDNSADYRDIFLNDRPLMDVRAPVEFLKGAFPQALNRPLMNDIERQKVGTCYKQQGQDAAIALGHQLVGGTVKAERIAAWAEFARANPDGYLYCFRGGLRSQITQLEKDQKRRATRAQRDVLDRFLLDLLSLYRDVLVLQLGSDVDLVNVADEHARALAAASTPEQTIRRMDAVGAARTALAGNVAPLLAVEAMAVALRPQG